MERKLGRAAPTTLSPLLGGFVALSAWLTCAAALPAPPARGATAAGMDPFATAMPTMPSAPFKGNELAAGAGVVARVERSLAITGDELLRGETRFKLRGSGTLRVTETAHIDGFGRLDRAEISLDYEGDVAPAPESVLRETLDAGGGVLSVTRASGLIDTRSVPVTLPWVYLPVVLDSGERMSTPVAARVALRAAEVSRFALELAAFEPEAAIATDQLEVASETRKWVLLGDDLATFDARGDLLALNVSALGLQIRVQL